MRYTNRRGLMEFAGVDKAARSKMGVWKMTLPQIQRSHRGLTFTSYLCMRGQDVAEMTQHWLAIVVRILLLKNGQ